MGNTAEKQRKKKQEDEINRARIEVEIIKKTKQLKQTILAATNNGESSGLWKKEWKVALQELVIDRIMVTYKDSDYILGFHNVPGLTLRSFGYSTASWQFPNVENSAYQKYQWGVDCARVFECLGMDKQLPYNLWRQLIFPNFYIFLNGANLAGRYKYDHQEGMHLHPDLRKRLYSGNQAYVYPQHYAPDIFHDIPCDRGWIYLHSTPSNGSVDICAPLWDYPIFRFRLRDYFKLIQSHNLIEILFRHDKQKCNLAKQLLETISCTIQSNPLSLTSLMTSVKMTTICPEIIRTSSQDFVCILKHLAPFASSYQLANFAMQVEEKKSEAATLEFEKLKETREKELFLVSQFDPYELANLIRCIVKINVEYFYLFVEDNANANAKSAPTHNFPKFPSLDDHFDNPKNLRGRVTETPVHKEMESFRNYLSAFERQLADDEDCKLPVVLAKLTADYLLFPQPSADILLGYGEFVSSWVISNTPRRSPLSTW